MRKVSVFVEGGGDSKNQSANIACRKAFRSVAQKLDVKNMPTFVACGSRTSTWEIAWQAYSNRDPEDCVFLLVDSEEKPSEANNLPQFAWKHLRERQFDRWLSLSPINSNYVFLMVTTMETWLIADPSALKSFFSHNFNSDLIPDWLNLEEVEKPRPLEILKKASAECASVYEKGKISFEILEKVSPSIVASRCPHAKFFFDRLVAECA